MYARERQTDRPRTSTETTRVCGDCPTLLFARHRYVPASNLRTELILSDPVSITTHVTPHYAAPARCIHRFVQITAVEAEKAKTNGKYKTYFF